MVIYVELSNLICFTIYDENIFSCLNYIKSRNKQSTQDISLNVYFIIGNDA